MTECELAAHPDQCPFCGGRAYVNNAKSHGCQLHGEKEIIWRVQCKHKDVKWKDSTHLPECHVKPVAVGRTRDEAISRWNTRAGVA